MTGQTENRLRGLKRLLRGVGSSAGACLFPLGRWWRPGLSDIARESRLEQGYTIVLPGIEGRSFLNAGIVRGLADGGLESAIEVIDWTTGVSPLFLYHLRAARRNRRAADAIAGRIVEYQAKFPDRPVHLVGHSGGGAMALWILESLPIENRISTAVLLAPAISPAYPVCSLLSKTERGIWNFYSPFDMAFLGVGTLLCGTVDGRHCVSAGATGFHGIPDECSRDQYDSSPRLHQRRYQPEMVRQFNFGGHFGCVNRVFVTEQIAPLLKAGEIPAEA